VSFPLTILHLTDLHFGADGHYWTSDESTEAGLPPEERRGLAGSLERDLRVRLQQQPGLVLITGDLLDKAQPSGVPMAVAFLEELATVLNLSRDRFAFVPGNHDVIESAELKSRYDLFAEIVRGFLGHAPDWLSADRQAHHRAFVARVRDLDVTLVGLNSCETLSIERHGSVSASQRDFLERSLPQLQASELRIGMVHHHLMSPAGLIRKDYSVMNDANGLLEWLAQHRFHVVLHGHQHLDWYRSIGFSDGWQIAVCAGASLGVAAYGRAEWQLRLGYQVIRIGSTTTGERYRREFDPGRREWISAAGEPAEHPIEFGFRQRAASDSRSSGMANSAQPTIASLRQLLNAVLPTHDDFEAFCQAHFDKVYRTFSSGMTRTAKTTLLLSMPDRREILFWLGNDYPEQVEQFRHLLAFEPTKQK
jgi:Calcineurin-like phosphoesterase